MREIKIPSFTQCLFPKIGEVSRFWEDGFFKTIFRGVAHPRVANSALIIFFFFLSFWYQGALAIAFTLLVLRVWIYWQLTMISKQLKMTLNMPQNHPRENESLVIPITLENPTQWFIHQPKLYFIFSPSRNSENISLIEPSLAPMETRQVNFTVPCDAGMGRFSLGPLSLAIKDFLGMYEMSIIESLDHELIVNPQINPIIPIATVSSKISDLFGLKEIATRGVDVNFAGVRPYLRGDNIRHIAWRRTARLNQLIVKEFERLVPSEISIFANLNPLFQIGSSQSSTWETIKKLSLNLASQFLEDGQIVRFAFNKKYIERGFGREQLQRIIQSLMTFNIEEEIQQLDSIYEASQEKAEVHYFIESPLQEWHSLIPQGSTLAYITTLHYNHLAYVSTLFRKLLSQQIEIVLFLVNPTNFWGSEGLPFEVQSELRSPSKLTVLVHRLQKMGVKVYTINMGEKTSKDFKDFRTPANTQVKSQ